MVYLDNAATSQSPDSVINVLSDFYKFEKSNVQRGVYDLANEASIKFENVRSLAAKFLNAKSKNCIAFTKGTTEGNNIVAECFLKNRLDKDDNIVLSIMEHHSNLLPWQRLASEKNAEIRFIPIDKKGDLDISRLRDLFDNKTKFCALTHISNTLGSINDIRTVSEYCNKNNISLLLDTAQSASLYELDLQEIKCDFLTFSSHKIFGPFGAGILYVDEKYHSEIRPYNVGGGAIKTVRLQDSDYKDYPYNLDAGTPAIAEVIAMGEAIRFISDLDCGFYRNKLGELTEYTIESLRSINSLKLIGNPKNRSFIISFTLDGIHPHDASSFLNKDHIAVRAGMHCTQALLKEFDLNSTLRASFSIYNEKEDAERLIQSLKEIIKFWS